MKSAKLLCSYGTTESDVSVLRLCVLYLNLFLLLLLLFVASQYYFKGAKPFRKQKHTSRTAADESGVCHRTAQRSSSTACVRLYVCDNNNNNDSDDNKNEISAL